jgi:hypothetical protein
MHLIVKIGKPICLVVFREAFGSLVLEKNLKRISVDNGSQRLLQMNPTGERAHRLPISLSLFSEALQ